MHNLGFHSFILHLQILLNFLLQLYHKDRLALVINHIDTVVKILKHP